MENYNQSKERPEKRYKRDDYRRSTKDEKVLEIIRQTEEFLVTSLQPNVISNLNAFQRKLLFEHFEKKLEYQVKSYRHEDEIVLRIYPVGNLKRLAEQKAQEVLMKGEPEKLESMGSFERFVIHDYLKDRDGIKTQSFGEGHDRHVEIHPVFGRNPKRAKRRLT